MHRTGLFRPDCLVSRLLIILVATLPLTGLSAVPELPPETKTLVMIVLDVKAPLNRKLDELRRTYGIQEIKAGGINFIDKKNDVVMTVETNRSLNAERTTRLEEFRYENEKGELILHEKVITHGQNLTFNDFEDRLFQTGVENYDLEDDTQTFKDAAIRLGAGPVFRVITTREEGDETRVKRHLISIGDGQQLEVRDVAYTASNYRTYDYEIFDRNVFINTLSGTVTQWAWWLGTLRIGVRSTPGLLLPEVTHERFGEEWLIKGKSGERSTVNHARLNGFETFSTELHQDLIVPFIEGGPVQAIKQSVESSKVWPESSSMQSIGADSRFLNELIVIRNEVNQAKTNPAILSLIDVKLNVIIRDIQSGALRVNDFR